jgi:hypothetical protein
MSRARIARGTVIHSAGDAPKLIIPPGALHRRQAPSRIARAPSRAGEPGKKQAVWKRRGRRRPGKGGPEEPGLDASPLSDRLSSTMNARANPGAHGRQDEDVRSSSARRLAARPVRMPSPATVWPARAGGPRTHCINRRDPRLGAAQQRGTTTSHSIAAGPPVTPRGAPAAATRARDPRWACHKIPGSRPLPLAGALDITRDYR